jgi:hypothetical protein
MSDLLIKMPNTYEPLRKNRFVFRFPADLGIQEWTVESGKRPSLTQNAVEIQFLNTSTWVLGRYTWDDMNVTFRDMIGPSTMQAVMEWLRLHSESVTGRQGYAAGYKRDIELELLDPNCVCEQKWILKNAWISVANFWSLQYSDDSLADITATLVIDYAILCY